LQAGKLNLFCSGAGSKVRPPVRATEHTRFARFCSGFTTVNLQAEQMNVRMIDDKGT
jgi:hypothetical protein